MKAELSYCYRSFGSKHVATKEVDEINVCSWQKNLFAFLDEEIPDLLAWLFDSDCCSEEELHEEEVGCNTSDGNPLNNFRSACLSGTDQSVEDLYKRYSYIWNDYLFIESTGMDFIELNWFRRFSEAKPFPITDPDVMLLMTARLCVWGSYDFYHDYSLYQCILSGRYKKFVNAFNKMCSDNPWLRGTFMP